MKPRFSTLAVACSIALLLLTQKLSATPVDFGELSLLVRARESDAAIVRDISQRKLLRKLTPEQERTLKAQGASDSLLSTLRNSNWVASPAQVSAIESGREQKAKASSNADAAPNNQDTVHVFNAAYGHPVNLSQWGGADYEIVFYSYRHAGEDHIQAAFVDPIATRTEVSRVIPLNGLSESETFSTNWYPNNSVRSWRYTPYEASADARDHRFNFSDTISVSSQSVSRPTRIDWDNPVFIEGQPYTFYPVYGAGAVSLYYIGKASDTSATLAVVMHNR